MVVGTLEGVALHAHVVVRQHSMVPDSSNRASFLGRKVRLKDINASEFAITAIATNQCIHKVFVIACFD